MNQRRQIVLRVGSPRVAIGIGVACLLALDYWIRMDAPYASLIGLGVMVAIARGFYATAPDTCEESAKKLLR
jgi:hypothetical protein